MACSSATAAGGRNSEADFYEKQFQEWKQDFQCAAMGRRPCGLHDISARWRHRRSGAGKSSIHQPFRGFGGY
jgi:hypothetical protein